MSGGKRNRGRGTWEDEMGKRNRGKGWKGGRELEARYKGKRKRMKKMNESGGEGRRNK